MTEKKIEKYLEEYQEILNKFQKWISTQSHLPQDIPKIVLIRYLQVYDFDIEKAKELLEINVRIRNKNQYIFTNRDINSEEIQRALNTVQVTSFPKLTKEKYHISGFRLINFDSHNFVTNDVVKYILMFQDMLNVKSPMTRGDMCIFDAKGLTIWHLMKMVSGVNAIRLFMRYVQEAAALRLMQNHFVNCSTVLMKVISFLKPFMKKELSDVMHFHTSGFESLHEFIPKEYLPVEYDGTEESLDDYSKKTVSNLHDLRDYLIKDENFFIANE
ncbi:alpha-tocopherol transfer protein-like [Chironomus tepperi]|uniref:alpha-tocopherol transfer protein-like n=1 Tax=Chironomus tepperi TaxID=113505 RepID=UPI00391FA4ED